MNETANATLALGALPVMAHAPEEVAEMAIVAGALVLNIGTFTREWVDSMILAGRAANGEGVRVVLDPVGGGATVLRTASARLILGQVSVAIVRSNAAEVAALAGQNADIRGVESMGTSGDIGDLASKHGVAAGDRSIEVQAGHHFVRRVLEHRADIGAGDARMFSCG